MFSTTSGYFGFSKGLVVPGLLQLHPSTLLRQLTFDKCHILYTQKGNKQADGTKTIISCNFPTQLNSLSPYQAFYIFTSGPFSYKLNCRRGCNVSDFFLQKEMLFTWNHFCLFCSKLYKMQYQVSNNNDTRLTSFRLNVIKCDFY